MLQMHTLAQAKKTARSLEKALAQVGINLAHGQALDTLARMSGLEDYNALARELGDEGIDAQLDDIEREHIEDNLGNQYADECALLAHTGFQLRYPGDTGEADTELLDYVRVCDPLGREVAYWTYQEWQEDPQLVMGAILGALVRGRPLLVDERKNTLRSPDAQP